MGKKKKAPELGLVGGLILTLVIFGLYHIVAERSEFYMIAGNDTHGWGSVFNMLRFILFILCGLSAVSLVEVLAKPKRRGSKRT